MGGLRGTWLSGVTQDCANASDELIEAFLRSFQLATARDGELVVLGAAIGFGQRPLGGDPSTLFHAVEGGIQRAFFHAEKIIGRALDVEDDSVAVESTVLIKCFEDEKVESALEIVFGHS